MMANNRTANKLSKIGMSLESHCICGRLQRGSAEDGLVQVWFRFITSIFIISSMSVLGISGSIPDPILDPSSSIKGLFHIVQGSFRVRSRSRNYLTGKVITDI